MSQTFLLIDPQNSNTNKTQKKHYKKERSKSLAQPNQTVRFSNENESQFNQFKPALTAGGGGFLISSLKQQSNYASTVDTKPQGVTASVIDRNSKFQINTKNTIKKNKIQPRTQEQPTKEENQIQLEVQETPKISHVSGIDSKTIELWINNMLAEADYENRQKSKVDGLTRFGIDRKTLKNKGLSLDNVDRVFRCLFVYSFGFHEMLSNILTHTSESITTISQIWKVFGVLLEYCARGDFLLAINELEKEKKFQINRMEDMLTEKEKRLQLQEQQERERHSKLIGEVHHLQQQRDLLIMEKTQLEVDFKQADIAFNDEVALRLKFEYRINEIHSIHRELVNKHNKLLEDFLLGRKHIERLEKELTLSKKQYETLFVEKRAVETEIANYRVQIDGLNMTLKNREQQVRELDVKLAIVRKQENKEYFDRKDFEHQLQGLLLQKTNLESQIQSSKQIETELKSKNESLIDTKTTLSKRCEELEEELVKYQGLYIEFHHKYEYLFKTEQQLKQQYETLRNEKNILDQSSVQLSQDKRRLEVELQFSQSKCEIQQKEIVMLSQTIQQMKNIKAQLDDEFMRERVKVDSLSGTVSSKEEMIGELERCISYLQQRLHSVTTELIECENILRLNEDDSKIQISVLQKKIEFLDSCLISERNDISLERERSLRLINELDIQNSEIADVRTQFKNEVFEKNNLLTKTIFLNRVIENERSRNQELLNDLTQVKIMLENAERDIKSLRIIQSEQIELNKEEDRIVNQKYNRIISDMKNKSNELTYRMYLEDAQSLVMRLTDTINSQNSEINILTDTKKELSDQINILAIQQEQLIVKVESLKSSLIDRINENKQIKQISLWTKLVLKKCYTEFSSTQKKLNDDEKISKLQKITITKLQKEVENLNDEIEKNQLIIKRLRRDQLVLKGRNDGDTLNENSKNQGPSEDDSSPMKSSENKSQSRRHEVIGKTKAAVQFVVRTTREVSQNQEQRKVKIFQQGFSTPLNNQSDIISTIDKVQFSRPSEGMNKTQTEKLFDHDQTNTDVNRGHPQSEKRNRTTRFSSLEGKNLKELKDENTFYQLQQVTEQFDDVLKEEVTAANQIRKVSKTFGEKFKNHSQQQQKIETTQSNMQKEEIKKSQSFGKTSHSISVEQEKKSNRDLDQYTTAKVKINESFQVFGDFDQNQENSIEINQIKLISAASDQQKTNPKIQSDQLTDQKKNLENETSKNSQKINEDSQQLSNIKYVSHDSNEFKLVSQTINTGIKSKKKQNNQRGNSREMGRLIQNATNYYQK